MVQYISGHYCRSNVKISNISCFVKNVSGKNWYFIWDDTPLTGDQSNETNVIFTNCAPVCGAMEIVAVGKLPTFTINGKTHHYSQQLFIATKMENK